MRHSHHPGGFGGGTTMWETFDELRARFEPRSAGTRAGRGEVRSAVLALLAESPMHGYQIIREIDERTDGAWKPSAGSVYPTLQLLADEGLVVAEEAHGRKVYSLTEAGREAVAESEGTMPWDRAETSSGSAFSALPKAGFDLAQAAAQVGRTGTPEQVQEAVTVLAEARRRIYAILARDASE